MKPVNKKQMKHYYDRIKEPMDLETISTRIDKNVYHSRNEFLRDMELIFNNSNEFNGESSEYTLKAKKLLDITKEKLYGDNQGTANVAKTFEDKLKKIQQEWNRRSPSCKPTRFLNMWKYDHKKMNESESFVVPILSLTTPVNDRKFK